MTFILVFNSKWVSAFSLLDQTETPFQKILDPPMCMHVALHDIVSG